MIFLPLKKAQIKATTYTTKKGTVVRKKAYSDIRQKKAVDSKGFKKHDNVKWPNKYGGLPNEGIITEMLGNNKARVFDGDYYVIKLDQLTIDKNPRQGVDR